MSSQFQGIPRRVAVLGVGDMGRRHVRVLAAHGGFEVVGVVDAAPSVAAAVAEDFGVPHLHHEAEAIARAELVVVATPIAAHCGGVEAALDARRHVLVEKPICASPADADHLVTLAGTRGARLFVGHSERFNPVVAALAALVDPREVLAVDLWREGPPRGRPRGARHGGVRHDEESVLLNLGIHDIDLVALLGGGPVTLRRAEGNDARALLTLRARCGALAHVRVDRDALVRRRAITLTTATHLYKGDLLAPRLTVTPRAGGTTEEVALDACEPLLAQARALHDALDGRPSAVATGLEGARALAVADRATRQMGGARSCDSAAFLDDARLATGPFALAEKL